MYTYILKVPLNFLSHSFIEMIKWIKLDKIFNAYFYTEFRNESYKQCTHVYTKISIETNQLVCK